MLFLSKPITFLLVWAIICPCLTAKQECWESIFNGEDLDGWIPKVCGYPVGENPFDTFVVEDGILRVKYDQYQQFDDRYGHLFYHKKLSHYRLRLEYRFNGERLKDSKHFTELNSGVMFHSQSPHSMKVDQDFPVSIEAQFLAIDEDTKDRTTMNIASPGTHIVLSDGTIREEHMTWTQAPAREKSQWVQIEIEVHGSELIRHKIDGEIVLEYQCGILGGDRFPDWFPIQAGSKLSEGYIALQGESHPVDFRNIELMILE